MKTYLGETGLDKSWQKPFELTIKCPKCGGQATIMFVAHEENEDKGNYVCDLAENAGKGEMWVHDAIACAVYLCRTCFETTAILNQA
jgi:hypothetical protein